VVGSAVGGLLDTVDDGVTGFLVPPRDSAALVAAVCRLLDDRRLRTRFGRAARLRAVSRYGLSRVARDTESAYLEAISSRQLSAARKAV
jgi:D-inositol-3-phosphate glycosyltransferase